MKALAPELLDHFSQLLARREAELRALVRDDLAAGTPSRQDVTDFKDVAAEQTAADVEGVQAEHAAIELEQVLAARRRLQDHTYGLCLQCGELIDQRRLEALPATPYCTACQAAHEAAAARR